MQKNLVTTVLPVILMSFIVLACQKEMKETNLSTTTPSNARFEQNVNTIRLKTITSGFGNEHYQYNEDGLLERWDVESYGGYFIQEYNDEGTLTKGSFYSTDDVLQWYILFHYNKNEIAREIWYDGATDEIIDDVFYSFNNRGFMTRSESFILDYHSENSWTNEGNLLQTLLFFGEDLAYDVSYTYDHHHKNPASAHPGLTYEYPYFNGFFSRNKWYSVSQKVIGYENGIPTVFSDQDPTKTIVEVGPQNYVSATVFVEKETQEHVPFDFFYENYGSDKNPTQAGKASAVQQKIAKLMQRTSVKTMKQQIRELKQLTK